MPGPLGVLFPVPFTQAEKPDLGLGPLLGRKPLPLTPYDEEDEVARLRESIGLPAEPPIKRRPVVAVTPAPAPAPAHPARLPWSDPTRAAARVAARTKRAERLAMYLAQGLTSVAAEERANKDSYQEVTRASQSTAS